MRLNEKLKKAIDRGNLRGIEAAFFEKAKNEAYHKWLEKMREDYEKEYQATKDIKKHNDETGEDEIVTVEIPRISFEDYLSETKIVTKTRTVLNEDGEEVEEEYEEEEPIRVFKFSLSDEKKAELDEIKKSVLKKQVSKLAEEKTQTIYNLLAGREVDRTQIDRYKQKEGWARNDQDEYLQSEAELQGITVDQLKALIISMADAWHKAFDKYSSEIETFRVATNHIIDIGDFEDAERLIKLGETFGKGTTIDDIKALLAKIKKG